MIRVLIVILLFAVIYGVRLNCPPYPYFDESHFVPAGRAIAHLAGYPEVTHPPLGKLFIALGIHVFGNTPWAWRLPSLIFGALATGASGYLAFLLTGSRRMFWLTSFLLVCDGLWITQARIGLVNAPMIFFILASLIFWWRGHLNALKRKWYWVIAGACAGFAMACKWQGILVVIIPFVFYCCLQKDKPLSVKKHFWIYGLLAIVAAYFSTFFIIPFIHGWHWGDILKLQAMIPAYHLHIQNFTHRDASPWYTWPFLIRPVWFGFLNHNPNMPLESQIVDGILCIGNPFVFMLIIPAMILLALNFRRNKDPLSIIVLSGFFIFWLPSGMLNRYTLFHHFYPTMPFVAIAIAVMLDRLVQSEKFMLKILSVGFLVLIALGWAYFLPLWTGLPISYTFFFQHLWLSSWF